jgi:hypothetical protein
VLVWAVLLDCSSNSATSRTDAMLADAAPDTALSLGKIRLIVRAVTQLAFR